MADTEWLFSLNDVQASPQDAHASMRFRYALRRGTMKGGEG